MIPTIPSDISNTDFSGKIIIIGAGVSGLMAANTFKYMGFDNYTVLEASDRIGGRLKATDDFHDDVPLDLGAEWIHSSNEDIVRDITIFHYKDYEQQQLEDLAPSEFIKYDPQIWHGSRRNRSLEFFYQETKWKRSTWYHWVEKFVYDPVKEKVDLNSPVKMIDYGNNVGFDGQIRVVLADGSVRLADKIICTIPLAALQNDIITFSPPLPPEKRAAINEMEMASGFRILFQMREKFYPDLTFGQSLRDLLRTEGYKDFTAIYDVLYNKDLSTTSQNILGFVSIGQKELSQLPDDELVKAALKIIDDMFDGKGTENYIKHIVCNWTKDPYILGAYSCPISKKVRSKMRRSIDNKLFFAGEHTSIDHFSLVPGAAIEGQKAAIESVMSKDNGSRVNCCM